MQTYTQGQIEEWKKAYGHIYKTEIGENVFVWRRLKRSEYVNIMVKYSPENGEFDSPEDRAKRIYARQEEVAKATVLFPENAKEIIEQVGGIATSIADEVMNKSGFDIPKTDEL